MIEQFKVGFRMLRYGHGAGLYAGIASALNLLALAIEIFPVFEHSRIMGDYFLMMNGMWMVQQIYSVNVASLVQTSQWKKKLQTSVPVLLGFCGYALCYLIIVLIRFLRLAGADAGQHAVVSAMLLMDAVIGAIMMIYSGAAYKFFIPSTIVFFIAYFGWYFGTGAGIPQMMPQIDLSVWAAAGIGCLILVAGALLQYGLTRLFYRFSLDKRGQMRGLQKYM